jgi:HAE1 family hydrophobic/amphiphilic exporter-1
MTSIVVYDPTLRQPRRINTSSGPTFESPATKATGRGNLLQLREQFDVAMGYCRLSPLVINHQGQFPSVTLSFDLAPGATIGDAVTAIQRAGEDLHLPRSIATSFQGNAEAFQVH